MNRNSGREENYSGSLFQLFAPESFLEITLYIRKCFASDAFTSIILLSFCDKKICHQIQNNLFRKKYSRKAISFTILLLNILRI